MRDLGAEEFADIAYVREKFNETANAFNFKMMEPSPLEMLATLEAKGGAAISDEIYSFTDKGEREIALRFDLTIGLTRLVAQRRDLKMPTKLAAFAGVWRYDEPQAGRYRYFHQWDVEVYGPFSQEADAEVIEFVHSFFKRLGLKAVIDINDRQFVEQFIRKKMGVSDSNLILEMFRAIDKVSKKGAQAVLDEYKDRIEPAKLRPLINLSQLRGPADEIAGRSDVAEIEGWQKLVSLTDSLASRKVEDVQINLGIVRGLDYYSGIVFEVFEPISDSGALVGGGRYDRLTDAFGRKDIGATGAAGGVERIVLALKRQGILKSSEAPLVYVAFASSEVKGKALELVSDLRAANVRTDYDVLGRALRRQLEDAASKGAVLAAIIGADDIDTGQVILRSMKDGVEVRCPATRLREEIARMLRA
jgi:histidyl-tRNA synthetase